MQLNFIPKFLFYPNNVNFIFVKNSFIKFVNINDYIKKTKGKLNFFFGLNNFVLIYFYIGNFFIKNKIKKTVSNIVDISINHFSTSNINFNLKKNIENFISNSRKKIIDINKSILFINKSYYLPLDLLNFTYYYFKIIFVYFNLYMRFYNFFRIINLNFCRILEKKTNVNTKSIN
jgi:hypothetical protein